MWAPSGPYSPSSPYSVVEMVADELLAEHSHFCGVCAKGFKREANLRIAHARTRDESRDGLIGRRSCGARQRRGCFQEASLQVSSYSRGPAILAGLQGPASHICQ